MKRGEGAISQDPVGRYFKKARDEVKDECGEARKPQSHSTQGKPLKSTNARSLVSSITKTFISLLVHNEEAANIALISKTVIVLLRSKNEY
jgi:hypothetical protein